jgi:hypothetical protein
LHLPLTRHWEWQERELDTFHLQRANAVAELHDQLIEYSACRGKGSLSERDILSMARTLMLLYKAVLDVCALFEGLLVQPAGGLAGSAQLTEVAGKQVEGVEGDDDDDDEEEVKVKKGRDATPPAKRQSSAPTTKALRKLEEDRSALLAVLQ